MTSVTLGRPGGADGRNGSSHLPDDIMLDGGKLPELSIPSPASENSGDYKTQDGNWDVLSPSSSTSTSSIGSPVPSSGSLSKSRTKSMKPRRNQSSYYDEELGLWKCRNCGGTYDIPNPGSRQRREHKKACEETQRLKAFERARREEEEEQARLAHAALREKGLDVATDRRESLEGRKLDRGQQNGNGQTNRFTDDPGIVGAFNTTPDIPEREEVNFGAPKGLIRHVEHRGSDAAGRQLQQTQKADVKLQGSECTSQESRCEEDGAGLNKMDDDTKEASEEKDLSSEQDRPAEDQGSRLNEKEDNRKEALEDRDLSSEQDRPAEEQGSREATSVPLKNELSEEVSTPVSNEVHLKTDHLQEFSTPVSNKVHRNGSLDDHWVDKTSPAPETKKLEESEQVKHGSTAASNESRLTGTLYDRLVDLHDDTQVEVVTRSASLGHGENVSPRIARLRIEANELMGVTVSRHLSLDHHYGGELRTGKGHTSRSSGLAHGTEAASAKEDPSSDSSPDQLVEMLVGKDRSKASSLNQGVESPQNHSRATGTSPVSSRRIQSYSPRGLDSTREQFGRSPAVGAAACCSGKELQSVSPTGGAGAGKRNPSDTGDEDDNFGAFMVRNVGKFWKQIASVGAVAVIAWVGKHLADRQQQQQQASRRQAPRRKAPPCRRGHFAVNSFYWDD